MARRPSPDDRPPPIASYVGARLAAPCPASERIRRCRVPPPLPLGEGRGEGVPLVLPLSCASGGQGGEGVLPPLPRGGGGGEGAPPASGREARRRAPARGATWSPSLPVHAFPAPAACPRPGASPRRPRPPRASGGVSYGANDAAFRARPARANPRPT